jgi:hypothetical protein
VKRRRGRPPLEPNDPAVDVHVRMPSKQYDQAYARAQQERLTVPELLRRALVQAATFKNLK